MKHLICLFLISITFSVSFAQEEFSYRPSLGIYTGMINYEGDLKPNSFTFQKSHFFLSLYLHQPLLPHVTWRFGASAGKLEAADRDNRAYLQTRNLSFYSTIEEVYTGLELSLLDLTRNRFTPYVFIGGALFHFNPYTYDNQGEKIYLQPLSTEGQGLMDYPNTKPYQLTQLAMTYAGGIKYKVNERLSVGVELSQRKTFTDYLDDVSSSYVDHQKLLAAKGPKAVELSYRGDELPGGQIYPSAGEQRGTPTEKDWYYFFGVNATVSFDIFKEAWSGLFRGRNQNYYNYKCPSVF